MAITKCNTQYCVGATCASHVVCAPSDVLVRPLPPPLLLHRQRCLQPAQKEHGKARSRGGSVAPRQQLGAYARCGRGTPATAEQPQGWSASSRSGAHLSTSDSLSASRAASVSGSSGSGTSAAAAPPAASGGGAAGGALLPSLARMRSCRAMRGREQRLCAVLLASKACSQGQRQPSARRRAQPAPAGAAAAPARAGTSAAGPQCMPSG